MGKWATIFFGDFRRAILWGACGGDPGSIGALGGALSPISCRLPDSCPKSADEKYAGGLNRHMILPK